ncbi:hypothetical protein BDR22DRAFT_833700 [Usnea florida]
MAYKKTDIKDLAKSMKIVEIDLEVLRPVQMTLPEHELDMLYLHEQKSIKHIRARYSDCGSFCFSDYPDVLIINSNFLEKMRAKKRIPTVWGEVTSYNGRFYFLHSSKGLVTMSVHQENVMDPNKGKFDTLKGREHRIYCTVNITVFPAHLASARMYLLPGKDGDDFVRVLFLPDTASGGRGAPEVKSLRVTLNQILAKLEEAGRAEADRWRLILEAEKDTNEDSQKISSD